MTHLNDLLYLPFDFVRYRHSYGITDVFVPSVIIDEFNMISLNTS